MNNNSKQDLKIKIIFLRINQNKIRKQHNTKTSSKKT